MLIIDAYNLLYKRNEFNSAENFINALQNFCDNNKRKTILVFDGEWGYQGKNDTDFLRILYVPDADQTIKNLIKTNQNCTVVTSDNEIITHAKQNNAKIIKSENFLL